MHIIMHTSDIVLLLISIFMFLSSSVEMADQDHIRTYSPPSPEKITWEEIGSRVKYVLSMVFFFVAMMGFADLM